VQNKDRLFSIQTITKLENNNSKSITKTAIFTPLILNNDYTILKKHNLNLSQLIFHQQPNELLMINLLLTILRHPLEYLLNLRVS